MSDGTEISLCHVSRLMTTNDAQV